MSCCRPWCIAWPSDNARQPAQLARWRPFGLDPAQRFRDSFHTLRDSVQCRQHLPHNQNQQEQVDQGDNQRKERRRTHNP